MTSPGSPFHAGEIAVQERAGVRGLAARIGGNIRPYMPDQHRQFFADLDLLFLGTLDAGGQPWATVVAGEPGFVAAPSRTRLTLSVSPDADDPAAAGIGTGSEIGVLGLMPQNRRRNRMNGRIAAVTEDGVAVDVIQSFGNCPQYIQTRTPVSDEAGPLPPRTVSEGWDDAYRAWIEDADTFFIASRAENGVDVSHRGGRPGFVKVEADGALLWPDYAGNNFFNTLGNLAVDPRAGLLFADFESGDTLQLAGTAEIVWDGAALDTFEGAQRLVRFRPEHTVLRRAGLGRRFELEEPSPVLASTGTWAEQARTQAAIAARDTYRPFTIAGTHEESASIRSFYLVPADGGGVAPHLPGQYLPIRLSVPGQNSPVKRTYTLSDAQQPEGYRITVKREADGVASRHLHDALAVGDEIEVMAPRGDFVLDESTTRPVVLLSAGVGITPMIAMLNHLVREGLKTGRYRQIVFVHGSRDGSALAFGDHLRKVAEHAPGVHLHFRFSRPRAKNGPGTAYASAGRIDIALLQRLLPFGDYDFYLCGPGGFVADLHAGLRGMNVAEDRIHYDFFGPSSLPAAQVDAPPAEVTFSESGVTKTWSPKSGSLLDLAEASGVAIDSSCRSGRCGSCAVRVIAGEVGYANPPDAPTSDGHALACQAHPVGNVVLGV